MEAPTLTQRKRKRPFQDGELSKRLKGLNLERDGRILHIPVEGPPASPPPKVHHHFSADPQPLPFLEDDCMQLDNSKYKVYIHNIDDELSDSESDEGKLIFLPDIEKRIRNMRIPKSILADSNGDLAGNNQQLVLYNIPSSLTVPEERDSVRKAIIEARARARDQAWTDVNRGSQAASASGQEKAGTATATVISPVVTTPFNVGTEVPLSAVMEYDPDAMDLS